MIQVGVAELKAHLSEYLARVQAGEVIVVAHRGRPVARIVPSIPRNASEEDARLLDLQRRGLVRIGTGVIPDDFWEMERPEDPTASLRRAIEEDRSQGY